MKKFHIPVDDLFTAVTPHLTAYQPPNNVHFKEAGYDFSGQQVAQPSKRHYTASPIRLRRRLPRSCNE